MNIENTYEEVYEILSHMDKITVMKIPINILNIITENRNYHFKTNIDINDIFNEQNISTEAIDLLCWLDYNFWANPIEKEEINTIINLENKKNDEIKRKKYNPDNLFNNTKNNYQNSNFTQVNSLIEYKEQSFFQKILDKIKNLFKTH